MRPFTAPIIAMILVGGCDSSTTTQRTDENTVNATRVDGAAPNGALEPGMPQNIANEVLQGTPGTAGGLPDDRTPLEEPNGLIDYKSAEAAGQVVQRYGGLLEQRKFSEARLLWSNGGQASGLSPAEFNEMFSKYGTIHSEVGRPDNMEGAAGSSYITVPFRLFGTLKSGGRFNLVGPLALRRVNDVPGSSEEQRHWHIESSGLKPKD
jgi:hypothetical protein